MHSITRLTSLRRAPSALPYGHLCP